jgi:hypothetical protein
MNVRPALLLCGTFLIVMAPACRADRVTSFGHAETSPIIEVSARTSGYSNPELNAPWNARFMAGPSSEYRDARLAILTDLNPRSFIYSNSHEHGWLLGNEREHNRKHRRDEGVYTAVPESATVGYLLLGLLSLGFLAFRRSPSMRPI